MDTSVKIKMLEEKIEKYELQEKGVYIPNHILNTKTEFSNAIKENLKEQRKYCLSKICFLPQEHSKIYYWKTLILSVLNL